MNFKLFKKKPLDLEKIYEDNKHFFELLLVKDFVGYIPKDINEPALKMFKEYGEQIEKWTLWQSWYINRRAINDPVKITFYNGMMVYIKVINTMARTLKKNYQLEIRETKSEEVATSWLESSLEDLKLFKDGVKNNKGNKDTENEGSIKV